MLFPRHRRRSLTLLLPWSRDRQLHKVPRQICLPLSKTQSHLCRALVQTLRSAGTLAEPRELTLEAGGIWAHVEGPVVVKILGDQFLELLLRLPASRQAARTRCLRALLKSTCLPQLGTMSEPTLKARGKAATASRVSPTSSQSTSQALVKVALSPFRWLLILTQMLNLLQPPDPCFATYLSLPGAHRSYSAFGTNAPTPDSPSQPATPSIRPPEST